MIRRVDFAGKYSDGKGGNVTRDGLVISRIAYFAMHLCLHLSLSLTLSYKHTSRLSSKEMYIDLMQPKQ